MNSDTSQISSNESDIALIQAELDRVLTGRRFSGAPQMSAFLRYIVTETLAGNADRIKAYSVGVDALGKPDSFDAQTDPSVRVLALRLRKTLATVYAESSHCFAVIELKVGTYVPVFYVAQNASEPGTAQPAEAQTQLQATPMKAAEPAVSRRTESANDAGVEAAGPIPTVASNAMFIPARDPAAGRPVVAGSAELRFSQTGRTRREQSRTAGASKTASGLLNPWAILVGASLLAAAWQFTMSQANAQTQLSQAPSHVSRTVPTIYLSLPVMGLLVDQDLEQRILMMLSSRFVQSGTVNVVRQSEWLGERQYWPGEYRVLIDGFPIDQHVRIDTQIVNLTDGEMLFADSIIVNQPDGTLSTGDVGSIEKMAIGIVSADGPVHEDYCVKYSSAEHSGCPVS